MDLVMVDEQCFVAIHHCSPVSMIELHIYFLYVHSNIGPIHLVVTTQVISHLVLVAISSPESISNL